MGFGVRSVRRWCLSSATCWDSHARRWFSVLTRRAHGAGRVCAAPSAGSGAVGRTWRGRCRCRCWPSHGPPWSPCKKNNATNHQPKTPKIMWSPRTTPRVVLASRPRQRREHIFSTCGINQSGCDERVHRCAWCAPPLPQSITPGPSCPSGAISDMHVLYGLLSLRAHPPVHSPPAALPFRQRPMPPDVQRAAPEPPLSQSLITSRHF